MCTQFVWEDLRERDHLHDLCVDGRIILKWSFVQSGGMDWIDVAQNRDRWRALVNVVVNVLFSKSTGNLLSS
jgi:hypothetical protein